MQKRKQPQQRKTKKKQAVKAKTEALEPREEEQKVRPERTLQTDLVLKYFVKDALMTSNTRTLVGSMLDQSEGHSEDSEGVVWELESMREAAIALLADTLRVRFGFDIPVLPAMFTALLDLSLHLIDWTDIAETLMALVLEDDEWLSRRKRRKEKEARDRERLEREREYE